MLAERRTQGFLFLGQDSRGWLLRPHRSIMSKGPLLPLRNSLRIDTVTRCPSVCFLSAECRGKPTSMFEQAISFTL